MREGVRKYIRKVIKESFVFELFINEIDRVNVYLNTISKEDGFEIKALVDGEEAGSIYVVEKYDAFSDFEGYLTDEQYDTIFKENDSFFEIQHLEVDDYFKGEGIAGFLMNEAISKIKESGADIVYLNASPMGFTGLGIFDLVKFYEKFGFRAIPELDNYSENKEMILYL